MRGSGGKLCFNEKERCKVWKNYMERIMNDENNLDQYVEGDTVEGQVFCVFRLEVFQALSEMKTGKDSGLSEVSLELIAASGGEVILMIVKICQKVIDGF